MGPGDSLRGCGTRRQLKRLWDQETAYEPIIIIIITIIIIIIIIIITITITMAIIIIVVAVDVIVVVVIVVVAVTFVVAVVAHAISPTGLSLSLSRSPPTCFDGFSHAASPPSSDSSSAQTSEPGGRRTMTPLLGSAAAAGDSELSLLAPAAAAETGSSALSCAHNGPLAVHWPLVCRSCLCIGLTRLVDQPFAKASHVTFSQILFPFLSPSQDVASPTSRHALGSTDLRRAIRLSFLARLSVCDVGTAAL